MGTERKRLDLRAGNPKQLRRTSGSQLYEILIRYEQDSCLVQEASRDPPTRGPDSISVPSTARANLQGSYVSVAIVAGHAKHGPGAAVVQTNRCAACTANDMVVRQHGAIPGH